jgi:hypothetical protein
MHDVMCFMFQLPGDSAGIAKQALLMQLLQVNDSALCYYMHNFLLHLAAAPDHSFFAHQTVAYAASPHKPSPIHMQLVMHNRFRQPIFFVEM